MSLFNLFYQRFRAYHTYQAVQTLGSTAHDLHSEIEKCFWYKEGEWVFKAI